MPLWFCLQSPKPLQWAEALRLQSNNTRLWQAMTASWQGQTPTWGTMLWHQGAGRSSWRSLGIVGATTDSSGRQQVWKMDPVLFLSVFLCDFKHRHTEVHPLCMSSAVTMYHWLKITLAFRSWGHHRDLVSQLARVGDYSISHYFFFSPIYGFYVGLYRIPLCFSSGISTVFHYRAAGLFLFVCFLTQQI